MSAFSAKRAPSPGELAGMDLVQLVRVRRAALDQISAAKLARHRPEQQVWANAMLGADARIGTLLRPEDYGVSRTKDSVVIDAAQTFETMARRGQYSIDLHPGKQGAPRPAKAPRTARATDGDAGVAERVAAAKAGLYGTGSRDDARARARAVRAGMVRST